MIKKSKGRLLVNQLLITGNEQNRFISFNYDHGQIDYKSTTYNTPQKDLRKMSLSVLRNNFSILNNSILTDNEINYISNNIVFFNINFITKNPFFSCLNIFILLSLII